MAYFSIAYPPTINKVEREKSEENQRNSDLKCKPLVLTSKYKKEDIWAIEI